MKTPARSSVVRRTLIAATLALAVSACARQDGTPSTDAAAPSTRASSAQAPAATPPSATPGPASGMSAGSAALQKIMDEAKQQPMPMTGDVDSDFASMMTMHHQAGIRMMDVLLQNGRSEELKALATQMKAEQQDDITKLAPHTKATGRDTQGMANMPGMEGHGDAAAKLHQIMTDAQNQPMTMSGDVDKDFAMMMTMHHQAAIKMAEIEAASGMDGALKALATKMKAAQQEEIQKLEPFAG